MERDQKILATKYMFFSFLKWYGHTKNMKMGSVAPDVSSE